MELKCTQLSRRIIELSGDDAFAFLQGLVSNDVMRLKKGEPVYAALLSPQGKFLHDFFLIPWNESVLIDCDAQSLADVLARLSMYKLRSKVTISPRDDLGVMAVWGDLGFRMQDSGFSVFADPRLAPLGFRMTGDMNAMRTACEAQGIQADSDMAYERLRLELGVPDGARDMIRERSLLLEFGFEDLHGVDFNKGCYVGQEVTARSKYRGQVRKFIYQVRAEGMLPPCGTPVTLDGAAAGELRTSLDGMGLALLNVEAVEKSHSGETDFQAENIAFKAALPRWVAHAPKALIIGE